MNRHDDVDFEIRFFEGVLKKRPDFAEALAALGELYTKKGLYQKGLSVDKKLARLKPKNPIVLYNLACSYSLVGDVAKAFRAIKKAILHGYDDIDYLKKDSDLVNLRASGRFQKYLTGLKQKKTAAK